MAGSACSWRTPEEVKLAPANGACFGSSSRPQVADRKAVPVSIAVSTLNRAPYLRRLLASLQHLAYKTFEVVVVGGPSTDDTEGVFVEFAGRIKIARCSEANLNRWRNIGIEAAAGEIVVFISDNALPGTPDWLDLIVAQFTRNPCVGASGGTVLMGDSTQPEFDGEGASDRCLSESAMGNCRGAESLGKMRWVPVLNGANCAFRRHVLLSVGGFDEVITYQGDETDICLRIARAGWDITVERRAFVRRYAARVDHDRHGWLDLDRRALVRAQTYYLVKNEAGPLPRRIFNALRQMLQRTFGRDIIRHRRQGRCGLARWLVFLSCWARGVTSGLWLGSTRAGRTPLCAGMAPPSPFLQLPRQEPGRRMRIGLLCRVYPPHPRLGGIARHTQELAYGLHALGHEVHVFTESSVTLRREGLRLFIHGLSLGVLPSLSTLPRTREDLRWALAAAEAVIDLAREGTVLDIVQSPNWAVEGVALRRSGLVPLVVGIFTPLTAVAQSERITMTSDLQAAISLERWLIANADGVTGSTQGILETVRDTMGLDLRQHPHYARIPLGIPPAPPLAERLSKRRRLLFVGRLERRKGIQTLLAVLPQMLLRYRDLIVDIVGDDTVMMSGETFRQRFESEHRGEAWLRRCRFHGVLSDEAVQKLYRECSVLVAPSLYESFGLIYLEAMRHGKPVIGCGTGGIPEVIRDGETGLLVPPEDPEALRAAIARLLDDPELCRCLGTLGWRSVQTDFASELMARRTADSYARLLKEVAVRYQPGLAGFCERPVNLTDAGRVQFTGRWDVRAEANGDSYRVCTVPGSALELTVPSGCAPVFYFSGHVRAGVVSLTAGEHHEYFDLYRETQLDDLRWETGSVGSQGLKEAMFTLRLESEANPQAEGREAWLRRVALCKLGTRRQKV